VVALVDATKDFAHRNLEKKILLDLSAAALGKTFYLFVLSPIFHLSPFHPFSKLSMLGPGGWITDVKRMDDTMSKKIILKMTSITIVQSSFLI